jgi:hypothetical protein
VRRSAPACRSQWNRLAGAPRGACCPVPVAGSPYPEGRGDGCARKRFQCGDAPIRRSGPPRHRALGARGCRSSRGCRVKLPCWCRCRSADAAGTIRPPKGTGSAPDGRSGAIRLGARRPPPGGPRPKPRDSFALRPHPPKWAGVRARRNLTEQPTSRLCSADESVVTRRRCQRPATRSFHGLCFLYKVAFAPPQPGDAVPKAPLSRAEARLPSASDLPP